MRKLRYKGFYLRANLRPHKDLEPGLVELEPEVKSLKCAAVLHVQRCLCLAYGHLNLPQREFRIAMR